MTRNDLDLRAFHPQPPRRHRGASPFPFPKQAQATDEDGMYFLDLLAAVDYGQESAEYQDAQASRELELAPPLPVEEPQPEPRPEPKPKPEAEPEPCASI